MMIEIIFKGFGQDKQKIIKIDTFSSSINSILCIL